MPALACACSYCSKLWGTLYSSCSVFFNMKLYTILESLVYLSVMLPQIGEQIVIFGSKTVNLRRFAPS